MPERRVRRQHVVLLVALLDRADEIRDEVVVAFVAKVDERARLDDVAGGVGVDHDRVLQHLLELADAGLVEAVLVLGRVVVGVLLDVAVLPGPLDRERELAPPRGGAFFQFRLQPGVGLGREVGLGHGGQGTWRCAESGDRRFRGRP